MNKKKLFQGLVVGLLANIIGLITAAIVLGKLSGLSDNILTVLESAQSENF
jgi:cell division protein FtsX